MSRLAQGSKTFGKAVIVICTLLSMVMGCNPSPSLTPTPTKTPKVPAMPTAVSSVPTQPVQEPVSGAQGGADSPEKAVLAAFRAMEANDANAYLDVVDPQFRSNVGNYFFFSQFLSAVLELSGLGGTLGKDASRVNFRDLTAQVIDIQDTLALVRASGFIRSPAFAVEQAFEDISLVRQIGGRWFISSTPTASETASATQTARQNEEQQAKLEEQQRQLLANAILQKGELVEFPGCAVDSGYPLGPSPMALRPSAQWMVIPKLVSVGRWVWQIRISPDGKRVAWVDSYYHTQAVGVMDIDGGNNQELSYPKGAPLSVNWASDNRRLIITTDNAVHTLDLSSGKTDTVWKGFASDATFMPDGKSILLSYSMKEGGTGVLAIYDPGTGDEKKIASLPRAPRNMTWSPDAKQIAFDTQDGVWVIYPDGSNVKQLAGKRQGNVYARSPLWSPDGTLLLVHYGFDGTMGTRIDSVGLVRPDGKQIPGYIYFPYQCSNKGGAWWIQQHTPVVKAQIDLIEEGSKERTVSVNFVDQLYGLKFTLLEFQVTKDHVRGHLVIENTGSFGKVFLQPTKVTLSIVTQSTVIGFPLRIVTDMPSVLPIGKSWDGWLESDQPAPPDAIGATLVFKSFEFEKPYDQSGSTKADWDSTQEGEEVWYQPLR